MDPFISGFKIRVTGPLTLFQARGGGGGFRPRLFNLLAHFRTNGDIGVLACLVGVVDIKSKGRGYTSTSWCTASTKSRTTSTNLYSWFSRWPAIFTPKLQIRIRIRELSFKHVSYVYYKILTTSLFWSNNMISSASNTLKFRSILKNWPRRMCNIHCEKALLPEIS